MLKLTEAQHIEVQQQEEKHFEMYFVRGYGLSRDFLDLETTSESNGKWTELNLVETMWIVIIHQTHHNDNNDNIIFSSCQWSVMDL